MPVHVWYPGNNRESKPDWEWPDAEDGSATYSYLIDNCGCLYVNVVGADANSTGLSHTSTVTVTVFAAGSWGRVA